MSGVVHRDIKVDNCLISDLGIAKLGDFGLAHILPSPNSSDQLFKGMGSRKYRAPEVVQDRSGNTGFSGFQADVRMLNLGSLRQALRDALSISQFPICRSSCLIGHLSTS